MTMRLLEGEVLPQDDRDATIARLERENRQLQRDIAAANAESSRAKDDAQHALGNLRRQLSPLYRALQMVFGELDAAGVGEPNTKSPDVDSRTSAVWENWKDKLGPMCAKVIDAMLLHGGMTQQQIAIAVGTTRQNVSSNLLPKFRKLGLIEKNGDRYALKPLS